ncbi:hypothetical protein E6_48 [Propionibacterium phage E6]|uniref:RusA n=1 Tax=Propionibacterium phage E6 TaxID=1897536 RepID=A0A1D8EU48_9CAUD|nr:RusA-like Holliday junction resolvase [Propionibacterium phage E6]AOT24577.1 hypothetical protein E6_48 [Propionibacterium phage E6]
MSRSRRSARTAGTRFETAVADYLARHVDDAIERRARNGAKDRGDISGLRHMRGRLVVECKDYGGRLAAAQWVSEADTERGNDDALAGIVVAKRRGTQAPADQWVLTTLGELVALINGNRDHYEQETK